MKNTKHIYEQYMSNQLIHLNPVKLGPQIIGNYQFYMKYLPQNKDAHILDYGCGMGFFIFFLKSIGYSNFWGVDYSKECIDYIKSSIGNYAQILDNEEQFWQEHKNKYTFIFMKDVIEHIPKDYVITVLSGIKNMLVKGGKVFIETNNASLLVGLHIRYSDITHEFAYNEYSLKEVLRMAGFRQIEMIPKEDFSAKGKKGIKKLFWIIAHKILINFYKITYALHGLQGTKIFTNRIIAIATK